MHMCMLAWKGYNHIAKVRGKARGWRAELLQSREQKPSDDTENSEIKRWPGVASVAFVTTGTCRVHIVFMPGSVLNSFQASDPQNHPRGNVINTQMDAHKSILVSSRPHDGIELRYKSTQSDSSRTQRLVSCPLRRGDAWLLEPACHLCICTEQE